MKENLKDLLKIITYLAIFAFLIVLFSKITYFKTGGILAKVLAVLTYSILTTNCGAVSIPASYSAIYSSTSAKFEEIDAETTGRINKNAKAITITPLFI